MKKSCTWWLWNETEAIITSGNGNDNGIAWIL